MCRTYVKTREVKTPMKLLSRRLPESGSLKGSWIDRRMSKTSTGGQIMAING